MAVPWRRAGEDIRLGFGDTGLGLVSTSDGFTWQWKRRAETYLHPLSSGECFWTLPKLHGLSPIYSEARRNLKVRL